jgi:cytochrome b561
MIDIIGTMLVLVSIVLMCWTPMQDKQKDILITLLISIGLLVGAMVVWRLQYI